MTLQDAILLIENNFIPQKKNARWVDLGCGDGLFTFALAQLLQQGSSIEAVDKLPVSLMALPNPLHAIITAHQIDFVKAAIPFYDLNGILMANSLHYVADKPAFIAKTKPHLTPDGCWLVVEYDTDKPNAWVPHPLSYHSLESLFIAAGYPRPEKLNELPSAYNNGRLYAAIISNSKA